jgi:gamma-glutamyl hercynylcysteine S-oxide synthase
MRRICLPTFTFLFLFVLHFNALAQLRALKLDEIDPACSVTGLQLGEKTTAVLPYWVPLFSVMIDSVPYNSSGGAASLKNGEMTFYISDSIRGVLTVDKKFSPGVKCTVRFTNLSKKKHKIENLVPMGAWKDKVYITAGGTKEWPQYLCRSLLFRPGCAPVGVILPDNAWHLGFADFRVNDSLSLSGLARRGERDKEKTDIDRWAVTLKPGGWAEYSLYFDIHRGDWHDGLAMMFRDRWLYDLPSFDNSLFERKDLQWMKDSYIMLLQFGWDRKFYNAMDRKYTWYQSLREYDSLTGGYDIYTLWPTWPRLGLDQRNQWDMYRDLPGGTDALRKQVDYAHKLGKKYFISYNPWDEDSRKEDQLNGMEDLLKATDADGVVLDTKGSSSKELQAAADKVRPGIIMYSEGMAVPKDMPGIVSGRVHDALVMPPPLNLNKLIKPDFAIFRVLQLADDRLHRELAISFFNGYGVEINTMRPGRPTWMKEELAYLGRTTKILRENTSVFHNDLWVPLLPTMADSIYVNEWRSKDKMLFTIFSIRPGGFQGPLFDLPDPGVLPFTDKKDIHLVDIWNHMEIESVDSLQRTFVPVIVDSFDRAWLGTRREGSAGCIALLPALLHAEVRGDTLDFSAKAGDRIVITGGNPSYSTKKYTFSAIGNTLGLYDYFDVTTEKVVLQLFTGSELSDEKVFFLKNEVPKLISRLERTVPPAGLPGDMVEIPEGDFRFYTKRDPKSADPFIPLPDFSDTVTIHMKKFYMDKYPVTNRQFLAFMKIMMYQPKDTTNFLKHWIGGRIPEGQADCPVVWVSREDIRAYAAYARKRLPTEQEWQYAAQGTDMRKYPWGNKMDSTKCNFNLNHPTAVDAHPDGASPFGVQDMIGNVWQATNDVYEDGCYYYSIIRGGSYYHPKSSIWYVTGGPLPADHPEMLLLLSPGLDRNGTVGFRLVKDSKP